MGLFADTAGAVGQAYFRSHDAALSTVFLDAFPTRANERNTSSCKKHWQRKSILEAGQYILIEFIFRYKNLYSDIKIYFPI